MGAPKVGVGAKELVSIKGVPGVKILHIHRENLDFDRRRGMSKSLPLRDRLSRYGEGGMKCQRGPKEVVLMATPHNSRLTA